MQKPNVVDFNSLPKRTNLADSPITSPKKQKSILHRFLLWSGILRASTMNKEKNEEWNWTFIAILAMLLGGIVIAFMAILIIGGFLWMDYREDYRTDDTWKEKRAYDREQSLIKKCENSTLRQQGLIKQIENEGGKVLPDLAQLENCGNVVEQQPPTGEH